MRPLAVVVGLLLAVIVAPVAGADNGGFTPTDPASPNAEGIRDSFLFVSIFIGFIFVLVQGLLVWFVFRYRRRRRDRFEDGAQIHGATRLELLWTFLPVLVLVAIGAFVFIELPGIANIPSAGAGGERRLEVRVIGRQFYWQYEYPNGVIAIDRMRAPAGVPVRLEVTSPDEDVIHSWWIPQLGGKIDAIPGTVNETWFEAAEPGTYVGQCAELCGIEHAKMLATVEVLPQDEFAAWLDERFAAQSEGSTELGQEEWEGVCAKCHGLGGEGGIGRRIVGSPILADEDALANIVRNGRRQMPAVGAGWSDEQVAGLFAYLREHPPSGS